MEQTLRAGDLLYMPRGYIHQAYNSGNEHSLHVTISTGMQFSWYDFFEKSLPAALHHASADNLDLRHSLPRDFCRHLGVMHSDNEGDPTREELFTEIINKAKTIVDYLPVDAAADQFARKFLQERLPPQIPPSLCNQAEECYKSVQNTVQKDLPDISKDDDVERIESTLLTPMQGKLVRLVHPDCIRLVLDNESSGNEHLATVYHCVRNSKRYHEDEEGSVMIPVAAGKSLSSCNKV